MYSIAIEGNNMTSISPRKNVQNQANLPHILGPLTVPQPSPDCITVYNCTIYLGA